MDVLVFLIFVGAIYLVATYFYHARRREARLEAYPPDPLEVTAESTPKGVEVKWTRQGYDSYAFHMFRFEGGVPTSAEEIPSDMRALVSSHKKEGSVLDRAPKPNEDVFYAAYLRGKRVSFPIFSWWYMGPDTKEETTAYITVAVPVPEHPLDEYEAELNEQVRKKKLDKRKQEIEAEELNEVERLRAGLGAQLQTIEVLGEGLTLFDAELKRIDDSNSYDVHLKDRLHNTVITMRENFVEGFLKRKEP